MGLSQPPVSVANASSAVKLTKFIACALYRGLFRAQKCVFGRPPPI